MHRKPARRNLLSIRQFLLALPACVALILLPCRAAAQTQPNVEVGNGVLKVNSWPSKLVHLKHGWRFHRGDNPAYARPDFDDSSWQPVSLGRLQNGSLGASWYRMRIELPPHHGPLALGIFGVTGAYEVYLNGVLVPTSRLLPTWRDKISLKSIPLPPTGDQFELAIRCVNPRMLRKLTILIHAQLGTREEIDHIIALDRAAFILGSDASLPVEIAAIFAGLAVLGLFYFQRQHTEYLWLGFYLITLGSSYLVYLASVSTLLPVSWNNLYGDPTTYLFMLLQIEFTFAFIHQKVSRPWRAYEVLLALSVVGAVINNLMGLLENTLYISYEGLVTLPATLILPVLLWVWYRKGNREAGLLVIPSLFPGLAGVLNNAAFVAEVGFHWRGADVLSSPILLGQMGFRPIDICNFIFLLAIGVVIFLRFTEVSRAEARTAAELDAARKIQQTLVPMEPPAVEGYQLAAAYLPAQQVGGDFYQVLPQPDGSAIVALGDVSGKGLQAAIKGAAAIGAFRTLAAGSPGPGALLAALNEQVVASRQDGFITMLCARIEANGKVTLANAGHLHPYRSGEEIELEDGLPLGVASGIRYAERQITLQPGKRLTLLSDGVVEARNKDGELFGFDRTQAGSGGTAQQMAEAAQQFGQEDDITVVTLTREGATATEPVTMPAVPLPSPA
jgi:phosphoserine phosphatase RsbU/P